MKVYVAQEYFYSSSQIVGVYTTEENAEFLVRELIKKRGRKNISEKSIQERRDKYFSIIEYKLDRGISKTAGKLYARIESIYEES